MSPSSAQHLSNASYDQNFYAPVNTTTYCNGYPCPFNMVHGFATRLSVALVLRMGTPLSPVIYE